ncbi:MOSC domain-containing protein [Bacillus sp. DNRA2]|uniref:MOSC domain-containing protein n=1 Tax=Bacillus sp. DNRA2 TaxID=2723053 RepID=UPI00145EF84F|nr:MOSC domain-containing protein [Bacillus sp. DNRA2]
MAVKKIIYLSKGLPKTKIHHNEEYLSGIWKDVVTELHVGKLNIAGDDVANHDFHGGEDRVICFYPFEHYAYWEKEFGELLTPSAFGENLTATNMKEDQVCIGDIFQIGDALLQVTQGRFPCATINKRNDNPFLLKKIIETGFTGYFFRVIKEGRITATSTITKLTSHSSAITVAEIHQLYFHENKPKQTSIQKILDVPELAEQWRVRLLDLLMKTKQD